MQRNTVSITLADGHKFKIAQLAVGESRDEFSGRLLCAIEDKIRARTGVDRWTPIPKGTRWVENHSDTRMTFTREHTGEPYVNRTVIVRTSL